MTEQKNGTATRIWAIAIPCMIAALTLGYSVGLTIGIATQRPPFITQGAQAQIDMLGSQFSSLQSELKDFRAALDGQSKLLTTVATKLDEHMNDKHGGR